MGIEIKPLASKTGRARFMTLAMWLTWLLRDDIRAGATLSDEQAQRDFVCWWLLWAQKEYPEVFSWTHQHAHVVMEGIRLESGSYCPRLLLKLHEARHDLKRIFPLSDPEAVAAYLCWYRLYSPRELTAAPSLPKRFIRITEGVNQRPFGRAQETGIPRIALALSEKFPGLDNGDAIVAWYDRLGRNLIPEPTEPMRLPPTKASKSSIRNDGVNLLGFPTSHSGLGEDVRMLSASLSAVGLRHVCADVRGFLDQSKNKGKRKPFHSDAPRFAVSIFCMSPFDMAGLYLRLGHSFFRGQYRIGYWPWELPLFPDAWVDVYDLVDEIWTGSEFTAGAYRSNCPKPVACLPAPVEVPDVQRRKLPVNGKRAFVFTYAFDPNSHLARKNPVALVRAFQLAFGRKDKSVALHLRANGRIPAGSRLTELKAEINADHRIQVSEKTLSRDEALASTAACDCFVSPHRAEGFGRNIAEAILLHVPVLATAFSGCQDYLAPDEHLLFRLVPVRLGEYPHGEGQVWAEPDICDMVDKMQRVKRGTPDREEQQRLTLRAAQLTEAYGSRTTGTSFLRRLKALGLVTTPTA